MKTSELTGAALDWAVATCEGAPVKSPSGGVYWPTLCNYSPSTSWAQGGPLIEREIHQLDRTRDYPNWEANRFATDDWDDCVGYGPTPLIAAMRCFVASKLGLEVDVPEELK